MATNKNNDDAAHIGYMWADGSIRPEPPPAPKQPQTIVGQAVALTDKRKQDGVQADEEWRDAMWNTYATVLLRRNNPEAGDAQLLSTLMADLELSGEQVKADCENIEKARKLIAAHDEREALHQESLNARKAYNSFLEK